MMFVTHQSMMPIPTPTVLMPIPTPSRYAPTPILLCVNAVSILLKIDDNVSTMSPNQVRESIWSRFSFALSAGRRFLRLPNCS